MVTAAVVPDWGTASGPDPWGRGGSGEGSGHNRIHGAKPVNYQTRETGLAPSSRSARCSCSSLHRAQAVCQGVVLPWTLTNSQRSRWLSFRSQHPQHTRVVLIFDCHMARSSTGVVIVGLPFSGD